MEEANLILSLFPHNLTCFSDGGSDDITINIFCMWAMPAMDHSHVGYVPVPTYSYLWNPASLEMSISVASRA
eukprot:scaffold517176_cov98-Attheya_sp.AAC.1